MNEEIKLNLYDLFKTLSESLSLKYAQSLRLHEEPTLEVSGVRFVESRDPTKSSKGQTLRVSEQEARFAFAEILSGMRESYGVEVPTKHCLWNKGKSKDDHAKCWNRELPKPTGSLNPGMIDLAIYRSNSRVPTHLIELKAGNPVNGRNGRAEIDWDFAKLFTESNFSGGPEVGWYCLLQGFDEGTANSITDKIQKASRFNIKDNHYLATYRESIVDKTTLDPGPSNITIAIHVLNEGKVWLHKSSWAGLNTLEIPKISEEGWISTEPG